MGIPWMRGHGLGKLRVQQLALWPCPMPKVLEQRGAIGEQGPDPRVQGGPGAGRGVRRGSAGTLKQEEACPKDQPCLGHSGANDQREAGGFSGARRRAEIPKGG